MNALSLIFIFEIDNALSILFDDNIKRLISEAPKLISVRSDNYEDYSSTRGKRYWLYCEQWKPLVRSVIFGMYLLYRLA